MAFEAKEELLRGGKSGKIVLIKPGKIGLRQLVSPRSVEHSRDWEETMIAAQGLRMWKLQSFLLNIRDSGWIPVDKHHQKQINDKAESFVFLFQLIRQKSLHWPAASHDRRNVELIEPRAMQMSRPPDAKINQRRITRSGCVNRCAICRAWRQCLLAPPTCVLITRRANTFSTTQDTRESLLTSLAK